MLNVSPIGRSCSQEERIEFHELDKVSPSDTAWVSGEEIRCVALWPAAEGCLPNCHALDNRYLLVFLRKKISDRSS